MEAVCFLAVLVGGSIVGHIQIPPGVVIENAVPCMLCGGFVRSAVHDVARNVLAAAECGEKIGEIIADAFMGAQCFTHIEILDEGVIIIVVLEVIDDPLIDRLHLFFVGFTASTNFVSKFFGLCVPQGCSAVGEIWCFRIADEIVCGDPCDQNESQYC